MDTERLQYLAFRLEHVGQGECLDAAKLVRKVLTSTATTLQHPEAEHALFHAVWDHLSNALDHGDFDPAHEQKVVALESEMAGRVLNYRLARGWLTRAANAPTDFRSINEFM
jgi:hypothetical protein